MIKKQEQEAIERIRETLEQYHDSSFVQHVLSEGLMLSLKLVKKFSNK